MSLPISQGDDDAPASCPAPSPTSPRDRLRRVLVLGAARGVDALYVAFQSAMKTMGLVPSDHDSAPEERVDGVRFAVLPRHDGRWPELRIRLPESAVFAHSVHGVFRRSGVWRTAEDREAVVEAIRNAAEEAWPSVSEEPGSDVHVLSFTAGGVQNLCKVTTAADAGTFLGIGQKIGRLEFEAAEEALRVGGAP